jgi:starch synthase (maltosyl-transferring)
MVRRENPALRNNRSLHLHPTDNDQLLAYSKQDGDNRILCVVSFDDAYTQGVLSIWT